MKFKMAATAGLNLTLDPMGKMFQNASSLKPLGQLKPNFPGMIIGRSSTKFMFFNVDRKSKMAATAIHILTLDPLGKCSNAFFLETTYMIKAKLYMNVHWMVLYNLKVFCTDMKFKMAATAGLSLTSDPMGKMFQNACSLKRLGQLKPNCQGMIIRRSSTKFMFFNVDWKSKMAATAIHRLTLDPMGKCSNAFFLETTYMIKAKLYMNVHWMVLYKLYFFCSDMKFKMAATAGLSLTLDPMGKMFQNASSLKPLGQLKPICQGMIIGRSSTNFMLFMPIGNPRWPPPQDIY
jgi:hypothetical protein